MPRRGESVFLFSSRSQPSPSAFAIEDEKVSSVVALRSGINPDTADTEVLDGCDGWNAGAVMG